MKIFISILTAIFVSAVIFLVSNDFGITWDEPIHFRNADQYVAWAKNPHWGDKEQFFRANVEDVHPPFRKLIAGVTHEIFTNRLQILDNTRGYRISAIAFVFPLVFFLSYFFNPITALLFSFLPHVLFLTPLVTMDYAVTSLWFIAIFSAWKGRSKIWWLLLSAFVVALTMLSKLHGFLLFVPISLLYRKQYKRLIIFFTVAFGVYVIGWPALWSDPLKYLTEYFSIQTAHGSIPVQIFGQIYQFAPWWYTPLMFLTTTPILILLLFFIGSYKTLREQDSFSKYILVNALYPIIFFALPGVYRYDWVRLFLPAFPFIAIISVRAIKAKAILFIVLLICVYSSVIRIHPWESAYYNELVGGISGAHRLGFETEYWGNAYLGILPWMNAHKANPMCVTPTTHPFYYYQAMGQLEGKVNFLAPRESCKYVVVLMRQGLFIRDEYIQKVVATKKPIEKVQIDGVPLVSVYDINNE